MKHNNVGYSSSAVAKTLWSPKWISRGTTRVAYRNPNVARIRIPADFHETLAFIEYSPSLLERERKSRENGLGFFVKIPPVYVNA